MGFWGFGVAGGGGWIGIGDAIVAVGVEVAVVSSVVGLARVEAGSDVVGALAVAAGLVLAITNCYFEQPDDGSFTPMMKHSGP